MGANTDLRARSVSTRAFAANQTARIERDAARGVTTLKLDADRYVSPSPKLQVAKSAAIETAKPGLDSKKDWYKDAVFYEIAPRSFADSNGDGVGDFKGIISKLDYLKDLGVDCLWLTPIMDSPLKDGGYDIRDYYKTLPEFGSIDEFKQLVAEAHERGIRVIADLVMNHTSDQHPWFQEARKSKDSPYRDYYVWSDDPKKFEETRIIFVDEERSNWTYDEKAGQYYWHRFFKHQPDLNYDNPKVQEEMLNMVDYWLDLGIDGFRLDAVPYLYEREGTINENLEETHGFIKKLRAHVGDDKLLLGEANQPPEEVREYFGNGDECQMNYHFPIMPRLYMALHQGKADAIVKTLENLPEIPENSQWGMFLRNHDELTLEMVDDEERKYMYEAYAPDPEMKRNVGIRRRLAPLLDNDQDKLRLMNGLLFSLPGSPFIYYGDEIGMGDNVNLYDRDGVRTPMQWSPEKNAGFSKVKDAAKLPYPVIESETFGFDKVNVAAQKNDPNSLLCFMKETIAVRRQHPVFGRGSFDLIKQGNDAVFSFLRSHEKENVVCLNNMSGKPQTVKLDLADFAGKTPVNLLDGRKLSKVGKTEYTVELAPHEFLWLKMDTVADLHVAPVAKKPAQSNKQRPARALV